MVVTPYQQLHPRVFNGFSDFQMATNNGVEEKEGVGCYGLQQKKGRSRRGGKGRSAKPLGEQNANTTTAIA